MVVALVASVDEAAASASAASRYSVSSCECQRGPKSGLYLIVVASPLCKSLTTTVLFGCLCLRCSAASLGCAWNVALAAILWLVWFYV
jgi:hypothetical protein